jgi:hypothetical protein
MRITESKIIESLLHPEEAVRLTALRYFTQSPCQDRTLMPLVIQAVEKYGRGEVAFSILRCADSLPQTPETVAWLTGELAKEWDLDDVGNDNYCFAIALILGDASVELLRPEFADLPCFPVELEERFRRRLGMEAQNWGWDRTWQELENMGHVAQRQDDWRMDDKRWASLFVKRLARHRDKASEVLNLLHRRYRGYDRELMNWLDSSVVELAGQMRLEEAIPPIMERLHGHDWELANDCETALIAIGGDAVVAALVEHWDVEDGDFRCAAADILECIHSDQSLLECLARFAEEDDEEDEAKDFLANALLGQFADEAIGPVRQLVLEYDCDSSGEIRDLRERLVATATVMGVSFPEYDAWYAAAVRNRWGRPDMGDHRIRENFDEDWDDDEYDTDDEWEDDEWEDDDSDEDLGRPYGFTEEELVAPPTPRHEQYLPAKPIRNAAPPVGRNDPCPCGSGKKYKKCCLGKERKEP